MLVLRYKDRSPREWKVPFNLHIDGLELPFGLGVITAILFALASINLITKQVATISGVGFTIVFFALFLVSERMHEHRLEGESAMPDTFRLSAQDSVSTETVGVRPGNTLCLVRDYNTLEHVHWSLEATHTGKRDLVVMTARVTKGADTGYQGLAEGSVFASYEQKLFSRVVALAEKAGKKVHLLVVPSSNIFDAIALTAARLDSAEIVAGKSSVMDPREQARLVGEAWERLPNAPSRRVVFKVVDAEGKVEEFTLGAHAPLLSTQDVQLIHQLWLELSHQDGLQELHHGDIVSAALERFRTELKGRERAAIVDSLRPRSRSA
jgi:hypothetical protein